MWWKRNFKPGETWEYDARTVYIVLDEAEWDIRPDSPDGPNDEIRIMVLLSDLAGYREKAGFVTKMHRCSNFAEFSQRLA